MRYKLMHKNIVVMEMEFDELCGIITGVHDIYDPLHIPPGMDLKHPNDWWTRRAIPKNRMGFNRVEDALYKRNWFLLLKCYGLNLSDQYWVCPKDENIDWHKINFFENKFSESLGDLLLGKRVSLEDIDYLSPDAATGGYLKKKWSNINGKRVLLKSGSKPFMQEPYNEVIATRIMERLSIPCVKYSLTEIESEPYSVYATFITPDTELITAYNVMKSFAYPTDMSRYEFCIHCCKQSGIIDIQKHLDQMITLDYLMVNEDRHFNNFGLIRDANTLEYICAAPIYDSSKSLWEKSLLCNIKSDGDMNCIPFASKHSEQIKLVSSFDWLDINKLSGIDEEVKEILKRAEYIGKERRSTICNALSGRIEMLKNIINHKK